MSQEPIYFGFTGLSINYLSIHFLSLFFLLFYLFVFLSINSIQVSSSHFSINSIHASLRCLDFSVFFSLIPLTGHSVFFFVVVL